MIYLQNKLANIIMVLTVGTIIDHERYGQGVVAKVNFTDYEVYFERSGKISILKTNTDYKIVEQSETQYDEADKIVFEDVEKALTIILEKYNGLHENIPLGDRWTGGKMILQPANASMQNKEIPIETFFHKIVMLRDRLRVLEQSINSHAKLSDEDKINMQQYITRIYGTLTTFNVLFKEKNDNFVGSGGSKNDD
ncbi:MAG: hypothetical protein LBP63_06220 [Prevotellaceae bacterium]|jgi:hypothetical protein|nr:hypothetical protein [Prevotellaceae bacterium]